MEALISDINKCKCGAMPQLVIGRILGVDVFYRYVCTNCNTHSIPCESKEEAKIAWNNKK